MKILVTGATGHLGNKIVHNLLHTLPTKNIAASVRDLSKAEHLISHGVDVRHGDFDKPETLDSAFHAIDKVLIISTDGDNQTRIRQHLNAVAAAKKANVKFIAYTSIANADNNTISLAEVHRTTEKAIRETGIPFSFLRNNWYLENETGSIKAAMNGAPWATAAKDGKVGWALREDYAEAAAAVLVGSRHENTVYELSGPLLTQDELAKAVGDIIGRKIDVVHMDSSQYADMLKKTGMPDFLADMFADMQKAMGEHALESDHSDFQNVLGHPPIPLSLALSKIIESLT